MPCRVGGQREMTFVPGRGRGRGDRGRGDRGRSDRGRGDRGRGDRGRGDRYADQAQSSAVPWHVAVSE